MGAADVGVDSESELESEGARAVGLAAVVDGKELLSLLSGLGIWSSSLFTSSKASLSADRVRVACTGSHLRMKQDWRQTSYVKE